MKRLLLLAMTVLAMSVSALAVEMKTFENKAFSIGYPADWQVTWDSDDVLNVADADEVITFNITFNELGPMKSQLKEAVDNMVYMKEHSLDQKVDQTLVKDDYALVRSIQTDEDDGSQTVEVWFIMISSEPQGFSGSINCPIDRGNEAMDLLVEMLSTLEPK